ncbi:hypothetical protein MIR68_000218 [Amoeboaphelidium protococcarum]|nr:hypothetical protein MIR68_000218 [Amoeboaphelidium protococcarum]
MSESQDNLFVDPDYIFDEDDDDMDYEYEQDEDDNDEDYTDVEEYEDDAEQDSNFLGDDSTLGQALMYVLRRRQLLNTRDISLTQRQKVESVPPIAQKFYSKETLDELAVEYNLTSGYIQLDDNVDRLSIRDKIWQRKCGMITGNSLLSHMMPSNESPVVRAQFQHRPYCGKYSDNGRYFYSATQDFKVHIFDCQQFQEQSQNGDDNDGPQTRLYNNGQWKSIKTVEAEHGQWTITDATLNSSNTLVAYSSITPIVHVASMSKDQSQEFDFDLTQGISTSYGQSGRRHFGIWSIRFSPDGRELVAGTSNRSVCVFDIETNQVLFNSQSHTDDVNSVCFVSNQDANIVMSASDDTLIKVYDRRAMYQDVGILCGHTEGLTYVASKGDGVYVLSNSKDQTMKLWDMRKLISNTQFQSNVDADHRDMRLDWDYRYMDYPYKQMKLHPYDQSVMTFTGHRVLRTLIRCDFSPLETTGSRYFYTGSEDGFVYIYDIYGSVVQRLDATGATGDASHYADYYGHSTVVRDVCWHPYLPVLTATSWNGSITEFSYDG